MRLILDIKKSGQGYSATLTNWEHLNQVGHAANPWEDADVYQVIEDAMRVLMNPANNLPGQLQLEQERR